MIFFRLISHLPFWFLYLISDFLFYLAYHVFKYRRQIVSKNLRNAFPDKTLDQLQIIERDFYKNLADTSVETLKGLTISPNQIKERVKVVESLPEKIRQTASPIFIMTSHYCNWEWLLLSCSQVGGYEVHAVYQRLRNHFFNNFMLVLRGRFGAIMHNKDYVISEIGKMRGQVFAMAMVADQRPFSGENKFWTSFMNQDAAFYTGTELLSKRFDIKVVYSSMHRVKRGYYQVVFKEIEMSPRESPKHHITNKFIELVEEDINKDPASYLWSHDRWKHQKPKG
jgi:KDO2-lipid IV(A) lauroyltransferase